MLPDFLCSDIYTISTSVSKVDQQLIPSTGYDGIPTAALNLVLAGGTGTGKTHLAIAIGTSGIQHHNKKVRFYSAIGLINLLEQEKSVGKQGRLALRLLQVDLVILDEWAICHSLEQAVLCCFTYFPDFMSVPASLSPPIWRLPGGAPYLSTQK